MLDLARHVLLILGVAILCRGGGKGQSDRPSPSLWEASDAGTESLYNSALEAEEGMTKWQVYKGAKFHIRAYSHPGLMVDASAGRRQRADPPRPTPPRRVPPRPFLTPRTLTLKIMCVN